MIVIRYKCSQSPNLVYVKNVVKIIIRKKHMFIIFFMNIEEEKTLNNNINYNEI